MCDYTVFVRDGAKVFLGGPPLVKMATGENADDEELAGADMHARVSGLGDYVAVDERDALRIGREIVRSFNWRKLGVGPTEEPLDPLYDADDLLAVASADPKTPFDPREVLDGSRLDEFKPLYGSALCTGWECPGRGHGTPTARRRVVDRCARGSQRPRRAVRRSGGRGDAPVGRSAD
jgi:acetyl-CoA carboxylase carboxyltransferase component